MLHTRISAALGIAMVLVGAATARPADAAAPPATQPSKVMLKLVLAAAKPPLDSMPVEAWIAEQTGQAGCPVAGDCSGWTELSSQAHKIDAPRLTSQKYEAAVRCDTASQLLLVELAGPPGASAKKKSLMLEDRIGQRDVIKLEQLPDGRTVFVALEVVDQSAQPVARWGEVVNNVRMHVRLDPAVWPAAPGKGTVRFIGYYEHQAAGNAQAPMWAGHARVPLEILDAKGKAVDCQTTSNTKNAGMFFGGMSMMASHSVLSVSISGEVADSTLTVVANSGTQWRWKLPPGDYQLRAVADFQDYPYRGMNQPNGPVLYSQRVPFTVAAGPPTSQPDGK